MKNKWDLCDFRTLLFLIWLLLSLCSIAFGAINIPFTVDADGVHLTGFELKGSQVIFDNDFFDDIVDHTLFMALGSYGFYDLVGIIVTRDMWEGYLWTELRTHG